MKGLGRKVSFLAVAAVTATALLGASYTLWYENLNLNATVATGTLDGKINCAVAGDNDELTGGAIIEGYPAPATQASHTYADPLPWASHPLVDPLWSTESLQFCHHGAEALRTAELLAILTTP